LGLQSKTYWARVQKQNWVKNYEAVSVHLKTGHGYDIKGLDKLENLFATLCFSNKAAETVGIGCEVSAEKVATGEYSGTVVRMPSRRCHRAGILATILKKFISKPRSSPHSLFELFFLKKIKDTA